MFLTVGNRPNPNSEAVEISFLGYTNTVDNNTPFALFTISNQATYPIRWWGAWSEVAGEVNHRSWTGSPVLPFKIEPVLKTGDSFLIAVGEPKDLKGRSWRFSMHYSRYTPGARWLDLAFQYNLPLRVGPLVLADPQEILNLSNHITFSSAWFVEYSSSTNRTTE